MVKLISYKNAYPISVIITLILTPVLYLVIVNYFLNHLFNNAANTTMFLFYNGPFWFLLMFITGMELYRRTITQHSSGIPFAFLVIAGSMLIAVVGIVISPVGPGLFSQGALVLIATNLLLGTVVGLVVSYRPAGSGRHI